MRSNTILIIGAIVCFLYIGLIVSFNTETKDKAKFFYHFDGNKTELFLTLNNSDKTSSITKSIDKVCKLQKCSKKISFEKDVNSPKWLSTVEKLLNFAIEHNTSKATIIADGEKDVEINFLLKNKEELESLSKLYSGYKKVKDNSSVIKVYSVLDIENDINTILKNSTFEFYSSTPTLSDKRVLNQVFRKLKELGKVSIEFKINSSLENIKDLKNYIKTNYPWIEKIELIKSNENNIKIKEVLS